MCLCAHVVCPILMSRRFGVRFALLISFILIEHHDEWSLNVE